MYSATFWEIFFLSAGFVFILPTIIAIIRRSEDLPIVIGLNMFGVVVPVFGWMVAMGLACLSMSKRPPRRMRQVHRPADQAHRTYDPGPFRGTPFESAARSGLWAEHSGAVPREH